MSKRGGRGSKMADFLLNSKWLPPFVRYSKSACTKWWIDFRRINTYVVSQVISSEFQIKNYPLSQMCLEWISLWTSIANQSHYFSRFKFICALAYIVTSLMGPPILWHHGIKWIVLIFYLCVKTSNFSKP